jgi:hypothetical protein
MQVLSLIVFLSIFVVALAVIARMISAYAPQILMALNGDSVVRFGDVASVDPADAKRIIPLFRGIRTSRHFLTESSALPRRSRRFSALPLAA